MQKEYFQKMNLIKTKIRNKISTSTQTALGVVSEMVKNKGGCVQFEPTENMIRGMHKSGKEVNSDEEENV